MYYYLSPTLWWKFKWNFYFNWFQNFIILLIITCLKFFSFYFSLHYPSFLILRFFYLYFLISFYLFSCSFFVIFFFFSKKVLQGYFSYANGHTDEITWAQISTWNATWQIDISRACLSLPAGVSFQAFELTFSCTINLDVAIYFARCLHAQALQNLYKGMCGFRYNLNWYSISYRRGTIVTPGKVT